MNVILPLGKLSHSLSAEGYSKPLQLTPVLGRLVLFWLLDSLQLDHDEDIVWLVLSLHDETTYHIYSSVCAEYRSLSLNGRLRLIPLYFQTRGVIETLHVALKYMSESDLDRKTICLNGDMIFNPAVRSIAQRLASHSSVCFTTPIGVRNIHFHERDANWSYCHTRELEASLRNFWDEEVEPQCGNVPYKYCLISDIGEHRKNVSQACLVGAYAFGSARSLQGSCQALVKDTAKHDLGFPSLVKATTLGVSMSNDNWFPLKTSRYLKMFVKSLSTKVLKCDVRSTRYVFQMYGGLCDDEGKPRKNAIDALNMLKSLGHHVTISSSRGRGAAAVKQLIQLLDELSVSYDDLHLHDSDRDFTVTVGSNVVDINSDLHKALGIPGGDDTNGIKPRHFNKVEISHVVEKTSKPELLMGEIFFYEHIPSKLSWLFPKFIAKSETQNMLKMTISKVDGITFSQLLVNRFVEEGTLEILLQSMTKLHNCERKSFQPNDHIDYYANYSKKVKQRFTANRSLYTKICSEAEVVMVKPILCELVAYEADDRASLCAYIHGDPVFSNCLLTPCRRVCFIDMNGKLGNCLTTSGDIGYDLAKILQSLFGYDYILLDVPIDDADKKILAQLRNYLFRYIKENYPEIHWKDVLLLTVSLLISLIPMHDNFEHQTKFWDLGLSVYQVYRDENATNSADQ